MPPATAVAAPAASGEAIAIPAIGADGRLYPIGKLAAHRAGVLHLAVSVFVFAGEALLIQQRAPGKYHCAGSWANTVCSHPHWGEDVAVAARRRLDEELGLSLALRPAGVLTYQAAVTDGLIEHERVHVFRGEAASCGIPLRPDPAEVAETRWMRPEELRAAAAARPAAFAPWFRIYLARWNELAL